MLSAASEYARVVRDLYTSETELKLMASSNLLTPNSSWNWGLSTLIEQITAHQNSSALNEVPSKQALSLSSVLSRAFQVLVENIGNTACTQDSRPLRLILCVFEEKTEIEENWTFTDDNGSSVSIPDYIESLVIEYNSKITATSSLKRIKSIEVSTLVFVPEEPYLPETSNTQSTQNDSKSEKTDITGAESDEEKKSGDISELPTSASCEVDYEGLSLSYCQDPFCFSNGSPLPLCKEETGFKFVSFNLSFVRPSYALQAITDLLTAHYNLIEAQISDISAKSLSSGEEHILPVPASLLFVPASSLYTSKYSSYASKSPHFIGKHLGSGAGRLVLNLSVRSWPPNLDLHGLSCSIPTRVTSKIHRHVVSGSLLAAVADNRPILISASIAEPPSSDPLSVGKSYVLLKQGLYIYIHEINAPGEEAYVAESASNVAKKDLAPASFQSLRIKAMAALMQSSTYSWTTYDGNRPKETRVAPGKAQQSELVVSVPLGASGKSANFMKKKPEDSIAETDSGETYMTTRTLDSWTRVFPLRDEDSLCYSLTLPETLQKSVLFILSAILSKDIPMEFHATLMEHVQNLATLAAHNDVTGFPHTRASVAKRRELYAQLWAEILAIVLKYSDVSANHKFFAEMVKNSAPDQALATSIFENALGSTNSMELDRQDNSTRGTAQNQTRNSEASISAATTNEQRWLKDLESARHDIVGMKDKSWSGEAMEVAAVPLPTQTAPPGSLFVLYWNASLPPKTIGKT